MDFNSCFATQVERFRAEGCGCSALYSGKACTDVIGIDQLETARLDLLEMGNVAVNQIVLGHLQQNLSTGKLQGHHVRRHDDDNRQRYHATFWFRGERVCRKTFLFLHNMSDGR